MTDPRRVPAAEEITAAAAVLAAGGIVAYPTETVYGLGVDARRADAVGALLEAKGRDDGRGISVLVTDLAMAAALVTAPIPADARRLAARFWPGPLTIVLAADDAVVASLRGPSGGIGLRCSSDAWADALVRTFGAPVTATSANASGEPPARSAVEVRRSLPSGVHVLDGGERRGTDVSTVVEFVRGRALLRRRGAVAAEAVAETLFDSTLVED